MPITAWKTDNYKFVGKAFDFAYANRMNKLAGIMSTRNAYLLTLKRRLCICDF